MKKLKILFIGVIFGLISGCATASFTQTGQTFPEYKGSVKVFSEPPKNIDYVEVGIVSSEGGSIHDAADLIKAL